jgi:hypothetical protein
LLPLPAITNEISTNFDRGVRPHKR